MKNLFINNKKKIIYIILTLIFTINYFIHDLFMTWDSTEYIGMSLVIGTSALKETWRSIRGLSFPFLLRLFEPLGYQNKYLLLLLTFILYLILLYTIYKIGIKLNMYQNKQTKLIYLIFILIFIIINPFIFMYYHMLLTEFIIITLNIVFIYLLSNFIKIDIRNNKKDSIIHALILCIIITFLYHAKQSFIGMMLLELLLGIFLSFLRYFDYKNILFKILTISLCGIMLISTNKLWQSYLHNSGVKNVTISTANHISSKKLITGIKKLKEVGDANNIIYYNNEFIKIKTKIIDKSNDPITSTINIKDEKDKQEIINVLNKNSKYKKFTIFEDENSNIQYVLFTKNNYSITEQIPIYLKIIINHPVLIINSYIHSYYNVVWTEKYYFFENLDFAKYYYYNGNNTVSYISPGYEFAISDLNESHKTFLIDKFNLVLSLLIFPLYRINQLLLPILFIFSLIKTIITKNKKYQKLREGFEIITLLYGMAFNCIISYVIFGALIDRYLIPSMIPMFIGDIIFIIYIIKFIKTKKSS